MKRLILNLFIVVGLFSCDHPQQSPSTTKEESINSDSTISVVEALIGNWARTNNGGEERTYEFWQMSESGIVGLGFTMVEDDTVFREMMSIVETDGAKYLDVRGVNPEPTLFKFSEESEAHFICVNDSNDFPKRIEYQIGIDEMTAVISAGDQMVEFLFKRIE